MKIRSFATLLALGLALAGCDRKDRAAREGNEIDPAIASALEDQIMVDPNLADQDNRFGARAGGAGLEAPVPVPGVGGPAAPRPDGLLRAPAAVAARQGSEAITLGQRATEQAARRGGGDPSCMANFDYSTRWAARMPEAFPLYPDAQVTEAAGNDRGACQMRLVSFVSKAKLDTLVDFYYTLAVRNGFNAEHQTDRADHILAGVRERDGGAYHITFGGRRNGTVEVDMIVNQGR